MSLPINITLADYQRHGYIVRKCGNALGDLTVVGNTYKGRIDLF